MNELNMALIGTDDSFFSPIIAPLESDGRFNLTRLKSADKALSAARSREFNIAVVAEQVKEKSGLQFVRDIVATDPFINCALASSLSAEEFHEATEGLGVFMQLPLAPDHATATELIRLLNVIYALEQLTVDR